MTGQPVLVSERLEFWRPDRGDLADLFALTYDEETRRHLGKFVPTEMDAFNRLMRNAGCWALHGYGTFMLRLRGETRIIGNCGVFRSHRGFGKGLDDVPEAGWIIHRDHWGRGIASEAMQTALPWFDAVHGLQRIACMIEQGNTASERLAATLGFARYDSHDDESGTRLLLYERQPRA